MCTLIINSPQQDRNIYCTVVCAPEEIVLSGKNITSITISYIKKRLKSFNFRFIFNQPLKNILFIAMSRYILAFWMHHPTQPNKTNGYYRLNNIYEVVGIEWPNIFKHRRVLLNSNRPSFNLGRRKERTRVPSFFPFSHNKRKP